MELIEQIKTTAKKSNKCIVLPEGAEERTLRATDIIIEESLARIILLGNRQEILEKSAALGLKNVEKAEIIDPKSHDKKEFYTDMLFNLRKNKGMTIEQAAKLVEDPLYLGVLLIKNKEADGEVAGALNSTGDVLRPAFQIDRKSVV